MQREPDLADQEAARLLREIANRPQEAVIFPLHHGAWSGNVVEALLRGAERLDPEGDETDLTLEEMRAIWERAMPVEIVDSREALLRGAERLDPEGT